MFSNGANWLRIFSAVAGISIVAGCAVSTDDPPLDASHNESVVPAPVWAEQVRRDFEKDMESKFGVKPKPTFYGRSQLSWTSSSVGDLVIILGPATQEPGRLTAQQIAELALSFLDPTVRSVTVEVPGSDEHGLARRED